MNDKNISEFGSWKEIEEWIEEMIRKEINRAKRWRVICIATWGILIATNAIWFLVK